MFIVDWYYQLVEWFMWFIDYLIFVFNHTERWEYWLIEEGWLFIFIGVGLLIVFVIWLANTLSKYIYFHPIYLCPKDEKSRKRYLGRRILKLDRDNFFFKKKVPEGFWEKYQSLMYYWNGGLHKFLIPDSDRKDMEKKVKLTEVRYYVYYKGLKRLNELSVREATNEPVQSEVVDEDFFYEDIREKMEKTDDFGEKAVRSNAESQMVQLMKHSIPVSREDYPEIPEGKESTMRINKIEREGREEKAEEFSEDFLKERIDEITEEETG